ncbi:MFS transporter [Dietzia psychralcaliphila]|uniref:MFS transporter n=2 Tax=Dietzia psychralcaliphila TaxID=139021 RepID=A0AAD0JSM6_9ACTN|nr:MFS transporter [Dietzia psychralcaliphila]AWH94853.1 MFS transporter [Dietzia psychralcaliphila]
MTTSPTTGAAPTARRVQMAILALALGGFGIGVTEFAAMGLLRSIADDFGLTEPQAGHVITAYALGVVVGAPLLTVWTSRWRRRTLLLVLMALFTVGNTAAAFAPTAEILVAARFVAGIPHGAYFGVASLVAASLAGQGRQARAVSLVLLGLSVANVIGVPAATWLGEAAGWEAAFLAVGVIGALTVAAIFVVVPEPAGGVVVRAREELAALARPQILATLAVGCVGFGGMFAVYTYIQWTMVDVAGIDRGWMPAVLAVYGLGMVTGNLLGGVVADRDLDRGLVAIASAMTVVLALFAVAAHHPVTALVGLFLVGMTGSALVPGLQARLMQYAGRGQTLAASLNHSALNAANALGAWLGGVVIALGFGYTSPALAGAALAAAGLAILVGAVWTARRSTRDELRTG